MRKGSRRGAQGLSLSPAVAPSPVEVAAEMWLLWLSPPRVALEGCGSDTVARRAGSVCRGGRRGDFKLSGTFAKLHKPSWRGRPSAICSRNAIGNVRGGQLHAAAPPARLAAAPRHVAQRAFRTQRAAGDARFNLGRTCRNFKRLRQATAARPWDAAKVCMEKNAMRSPGLERREVVRLGRALGASRGSGSEFSRRPAPCALARPDGKRPARRNPGVSNFVFLGVGNLRNGLQICFLQWIFEQPKARFYREPSLPRPEPCVNPSPFQNRPALLWEWA